MQSQPISSQNLNSFLAVRQGEILAIAQQNTREIVKREMALMDFELLLSVNLENGEQKKLALEGRSLRNESWKELEIESGRDFAKMNNILNEL